MKDKKHETAFFAGISAFIAVIESFIPLPVPFFRIGFSNIPVCIGFSVFNFWESLFIVLFKTVVSHLFRGTLFSFPFLIGLSGSCTFLLIGYPFYFIFKKKISFFSLSILGAISHNLGQIFVATLLMPSTPIFYLSLVLLVLGLISGSINGIITNTLYNKVYLRIKYGNAVSNRRG